ncbi:TetR/AcrR family transcriptional regulator [Brevundimonas diminuta]|uniref:TetR/AcrR family transcriptional regulator n=1 Tax=Brevundimonas diminuta TaxID=293 RepID=UPI0022AE5706|nr:TetR/AcrR family transcriptional regulator [Brevundimonas diminuta]MCZ4107042.1 TetR/AcrR family transcriptional regulator [Brevundimonas diminuta]
MSNPVTGHPIEPHRAKGRPRTFDRAAALEKALGVFWAKGFAPATIAELCAAMGINPPSLYAAFGNKAQLFLEAVDHYERVFWDATWDAMDREPDVHAAIGDFFAAAAGILTTPDAPCGCVVVLGAINVPAESQGVAEALRKLREEGRGLFLERLTRGLTDGQLPRGTDIEGIATTLNTLLQGMSIEASDGAPRSRLDQVAVGARALLPLR